MTSEAYTEINLFDKSLVKKMNEMGYTPKTSTSTLIQHRLKENIPNRDRTLLMGLLDELGVEFDSNLPN